MDEFEHLDLVAEIAVALLGFIAVFLALSKPDGRFVESDRHFIQALVLSATVAIVLALSPRVISLFMPVASAWLPATVLAIVLGLLAVFLQARLQIKMSRAEATQIHWLWHFVAWMLCICITIFFVLGLFDSTRISAHFVSGVTLLVPLCLWVFVGVVFRRFF